MNRVFVLLTWHPAAGAAIFPVGVLGVGPDGATCTSWVPLTHHRARGWRTRLRDGANAERLEVWLTESGTEQLAEVVPPEQLPLRQAVEAVMNELLTGVLPTLAT
jgi:hypothetical protein